MKLSIVVPAHNEEKTISQVLQEVLSLKVPGWEMEIITINDGSTDKTSEIIKTFIPRGVINIEHKINLGKGAAILKAIEIATGDYLLIQDADGEYFPKDIPKLLSKVSGEKNTAVFGCRGIKSYPERGFHYVVGAKILTWCFNFLYNQELHDLYTGYKLLPFQLVKSLKLSSSGFEFEAEVACKLSLLGCKFKEVDIEYRPRSKEQGKHIRLTDAFKGLKKIVEMRMGKIKD